MTSTVDSKLNSVVDSAVDPAVDSAVEPAAGHDGIPKQNPEYQYWKHTEVSLPVFGCRTTKIATSND